MAAPSRHPLPPGRPRAFFARQSGTGGGVWAGAAGAHTPKGGLAGGRDTRPERPWSGVPGSLRATLRWEGRASTAQPGARSGRIGQELPPPRGQRAHTWPVTHLQAHTALGHTYGDVDVRAHRRTHTHDTHRRGHTAHTLTFVLVQSPVFLGTMGHQPKALHALPAHTFSTCRHGSKTYPHPVYTCRQTVTSNAHTDTPENTAVTHTQLCTQVTSSHRDPQQVRPAHHSTGMCTHMDFKCTHTWLIIWPPRVSSQAPALSG